MNTTHDVHACTACPWDADAPDAEAQALKHTLTRGLTHATTVTTHPTTRCHEEGCP